MSAGDLGARIRFHLPSRMIGGPIPPFYRKLMAGLRARGGQVDILARDDAILAAPREKNFDFVHNGNVAGALNLGAAYLADFYYCDPKGLYFESSVTARRFDPARMDPGKAAAFFARLQGDYVTPRRSRYDQPAPSAVFGSGHIAVFLQDWSKPIERARHMDGLEMIHAILADTGGRRVIIKPHPRNQGLETFEILAHLRRVHPKVIVTDANLHDILKGAAVCVSISSSVAVEGFLHRVPAVLFGKSDLHHCAVTVKRAADWPAALSAALSTDWPYEAFLLWFLGWHAIDTKRRFWDRVITRMAETGADLTALGLKPADLGVKD